MSPLIGCPTLCSALKAYTQNNKGRFIKLYLYICAYVILIIKGKEAINLRVTGTKGGHGKSWKEVPGRDWREDRERGSHIILLHIYLN